MSLKCPWTMNKNEDGMLPYLEQVPYPRQSSKEKRQAGGVLRVRGQEIYQDMQRFRYQPLN